MEREYDEQGRWVRPVNWRSVPDPYKPPLPYRPGFRLAIRRHVPIPPFGRYYTYKYELPPLSEYERIERYYMPLSQRVLMYRPASSPPHPDSTVSGLEIIDQIACRDGRGAQLVRCRLDSDPERILVAKIFDAFYYHGGRGTPNNTVPMTDNDYSREAAAYEVLHDANVDGRIVPRYYGSWTFDLPVPEKLQLLGYPDTKEPFEPTRPVRMVLYEWIDGISMIELVKDESKVKSIPPEVRLEILAKGMEIVCTVEHLGVKHNDWAPRNVILSPGPAAGFPASESGWTISSLPAVYLIDFNIADLTRSEHYQRDRFRPKSLPVSPRHRFFHSYMSEFYSWVPTEYRNYKAINGWLDLRWDKEDERFFKWSPEDEEFFNDSGDYAYVSLGPESPPRSPLYESPKSYEYIFLDR